MSAAEKIDHVVTLRTSIRANGYYPVPLDTDKKYPTEKGWPDLAKAARPSWIDRTDPKQLNTGILYAGSRVIDPDVDDPGRAGDIVDLILRTLPVTIMRKRSNSKRVAFLYRGKSTQHRVILGKNANKDGKLERVEILGERQQLFCYGIHPSGVQIEWEGDRGPHNTPIDELPELSEEQIDRLLEGIAKILDVPPPQQRTEGRSAELSPEAPIEDVRAALKVIPNDDVEREKWLAVCMAIVASTNGSGAGEDAWLEWSAQSDKDDPKVSQRTWEGFKRTGVLQYGFGSLAHWARQVDPKWTKPSSMVAGGVDKDGRPKVIVSAGKLNEISNRCEEILVEKECPIYQRGSMRLVTPKPTETHTYHGKFNSTQFASVTMAGLRDKLSEHIAWKKVIMAKDENDPKAKKTEIAIDPPKAYVETILTNDRQWKFPHVDGILPNPTFRPDGSLLTQPGYDPATRMYLVDSPSIGLISIKDRPTLADAIAEKNILLEYLQEFSFVDVADDDTEEDGGAKHKKGDVSRSVALSLIVSLVARGFLGQVPLHSIVAPTPGSGKSYLVDIAACIALGIPCPVIAAGVSEEEFNKILTSNIVAGVPLVCIDNINSEIGNDLLCQMIERPMVSVRPFGRNDTMLEIPYRGMVVANGNNLVIRGDLARRNVTVHLNTFEERPELKSYQFDPKAMILKDRARPIVAALTMVRAYQVAGMPGRLSPLNSFQEWSDRVRSMLPWVGEADPCKSMEDVREADPVFMRVRSLMGEIENVCGLGVCFTLSELVEFAGGGPVSTEGRSSHTGTGISSVLHDQLTMISGIKGGKINTEVLGKWFRSHKDRPFEGKVFVVAGKRLGSVIWGYCQHNRIPKQRKDRSIRNPGEWRTLGEGQAIVERKGNNYVGELLEKDAKAKSG